MLYGNLKYRFYFRWWNQIWINNRHLQTRADCDGDLYTFWW